MLSAVRENDEAAVIAVEMNTYDGGVGMNT
jgi:hypothetical protein